MLTPWKIDFFRYLISELGNKSEKSEHADPHFYFIIEKVLVV